VIIVCAPTLSALVVHVAVVPPPVSVLAPQPVMVTPLSAKLTVLLGVPAPGAVTERVAVNVAAWANTVGLPVVSASVIVVLAWFTVCETAGDDGPEALKFVSPK
jgi:hypothetical protein